MARGLTDPSGTITNKSIMISKSLSNLARSLPCLSSNRYQPHLSLPRVPSADPHQSMSTPVKHLPHHSTLPHLNSQLLASGPQHVGISPENYWSSKSSHLSSSLNRLIFIKNITLSLSLSQCSEFTDDLPVRFYSLQFIGRFTSPP